MRLSAFSDTLCAWRVCTRFVAIARSVTSSGTGFIFTHEANSSSLPPTYSLRGTGSRSGKRGALFSVRAANDSIMSPGWNMPVCQVAM